MRTMGGRSSYILGIFWVTKDREREREREDRNEENTAISFVSMSMANDYENDLLVFIFLPRSLFLSICLFVCLSVAVEVV